MEPPSVLLFAAFASFAALGSAVNALLTEYLKGINRDLERSWLPFLGMIVASIIFVGSGLQTLGFFGAVGYFIATPFVLFLTAFLVFSFRREYL